jgi:uncharacterized protein (DUF952 family)
MIYRIETEEAWQQALPSGAYLPEDYDAEGFIHCSALEQVVDVAGRVHHGEKGLMLLCISQRALRAETQWEPSDGLYYPYIYGPVNASAVVAAPRSRAGRTERSSCRPECRMTAWTCPRRTTSSVGIPRERDDTAPTCVGKQFSLH